MPRTRERHALRWGKLARLMGHPPWLGLRPFSLKDVMIRYFGWPKSVFRRPEPSPEVRGPDAEADEHNRGQLKLVDGSCCSNPLVVAAPRSGFSLLIAIMNELLRRAPGKAPPAFSRRLLARLVDLTSFYMTERYKETFARFGIVGDLIFNGEFHLIIGGPKWLDKANPGRASFRKYFGVRGMGDFLLTTSHPREVLEHDAVLHSHSSPALWLEQPYYARSLKFTSIRNPIGIINSASFSLNAMASEYIQRFMPNDDEDFIRERMGLYKLTDLDVVRGLAQFLKTYLDEYLSVRDGYFVMRWEDLIERPVQTIRKIASALDVPCSNAQAEAIWKPMDHINLLQFHKHNYRKGKGIVGDWKNSLINEHMEIFRAYDFDRYLTELGYPPVPTLDRREYSPYQKLVERYVRRGEVYHNTGDPDLFGFSFNKSNIDASKFGFKSFPKRNWTHIERTTLSRDDVVQAISDVAEDGCEKVNRLYAKALEADLGGTVARQALVKSLSQDCIGLMAEIGDFRGLALCERDLRCARECFVTASANPRYFFVTSQGVSATRWIAFALASHPKVFAAHGHFTIDSVVAGKFEQEKAKDDTGALSLGNEVRALYETNDISAIFAAYRSAHPGAEAYGNVHSYTLDGLIKGELKNSADSEKFAIANVVRHPVSYIESHFSLVRKAEGHPDVYSNYESHLFPQALGEFRELFLVDCPDFREFLAFAVSCLSALIVARDLGYEAFPHYRMESLTRGGAALAAFCEKLTGLAYSQEKLDALVAAGAINRHKTQSASSDERKIYDGWARWKKDIAAVMISETALKKFERVGYDIGMFRDGAGNVESEGRPGSVSGGFSQGHG